MKSGSRIAWTLAIAGALTAVPQLARAGDELKVAADVSAETGYATNPFAEVGNNVSSGYVQVEYRPIATLLSPRSVFTLDGDVRYQAYFRNYSSNTDYLATLNYAGTPTSRLTTGANLDYNSQLASGINTGSSVIDPTQPPPTNTGTDLLLFGTRQRQRTAHFTGNASYVLSSRDSLTANAFYRLSRYDGILKQGDHSGYGGGVGYSRKLSNRLQLGLRASVSQYVYNSAFGRPRVYSLQTTAANTFNSRWSVSGSLGASFSKQPTGGTTVSPTGDVQLCRVTTRSSLCAAVNESVEPTVAGAITSTVALALYSYQLSQHNSLRIIGHFISQGTQRSLLPINATASGIKSYAASAIFDRTLTQRTHFLARCQYRIISGGSGHHPDDLIGSLGISVRIGDLQ